MAPASSAPADASTIAFVGFGEAASAFMSGWTTAGPRFRAYDVKTDAAGAIRDAKLEDYASAGVAAAETLADAVAGADVVFSLVTADQALAAAEATAQALNTPALFLDGNSCAPHTKRAAAEAIEAAGGRYVDVAIMAPVRPERRRTPALVSGPHAEAAIGVMAALDIDATEAPGPVGRASGIKLTRSILVKGLEALMAEAMLTAERLDMREAVLASMEGSHPGYDWRGAADNALDRMATHGPRRAAENRESAAKGAELGQPDDMACATVAWQSLVGALAAGAADPGDAARGDRLLALIAERSE